jgi:peptidoglycan hydrolase-like protein with peptidoglycan-binding domain
MAALLMPAGADGPAWLVTRNFQALWQYNRADAYALAIGLLANAMRGEPPMQASWPTDDPGLSRAELRELQTLLVRRGHADLDVDGADGPRTRNAVAAEERALGLTAKGRPGVKILRRLRAELALTAPDEAGGAAIRRVPAGKPP